MVSSLKLVFEPFKRGIRCFKRGSQSCHSSAGQCGGQGGGEMVKRFFSSGKFFFVFCVGVFVFYKREYLVAAAWHWHLLGMSSSLKEAFNLAQAGGRILGGRTRRDVGRVFVSHSSHYAIVWHTLPLCHTMTYPPTLL